MASVQSFFPQSERLAPAVAAAVEGVVGNCDKRARREPAQAMPTGQWKRFKSKSKFKKSVYVTASGLRGSGRNASALRGWVTDEQRRGILFHLSFATANLPIPDSEPEKLASYGIPHSVCAAYAELYGITHLHQWQVKCLACPGVLDNNSNILYSAPTGGGKTMVAEIMMLRRLLTAGQGRLVLFTVPYITIVKEKAKYLQSVWGDIVTVEAAEGEKRPNILNLDVGLIVCSYEAANRYINELVTCGAQWRLVGCVVDEFHFMGADKKRGTVIELLLSKLLWLQAAGKAPIQICAMTATLNSDQELMLRSWLKAAYYKAGQGKRPVELKHFGFAFADNKNQLCEIRAGTGEIIGQTTEACYKGCDPEIEAIARFCQEGKALVFCGTKKGVSHCAKQLATKMLQESGSSLTEQFIKDGRSLMINRLKDFRGAQSDVLVQAVACGIGSEFCCYGLERRENRRLIRSTYTLSICTTSVHTGDLDIKERAIVEEGYKAGLLSIIVCTTTLSSGVNLPCDVVVIRSMHNWQQDQLTADTYHQMAGRSGRLQQSGGEAKGGKAYLLFKSTLDSLPKAKQLVKGKCREIRSQLDEEGLAQLLLDAIAGGYCKSTQDCQSLARCTFWARTWEDTHHVSDALDRLLRNDFVKYHAHAQGAKFGQLEGTKKGLAAVSSGLDPAQAGIIFDALSEAATKGLVLVNDFHPLYLCAPVDSSDNVLAQRDNMLVQKAGAIRDAVDRGIISESLFSQLLGKNAYSAISRVIMGAGFFGDLIKLNRVYAALVMQKIIGDESSAPSNTLTGDFRNVAFFFSCCRVVSFCKELGWTTLSHTLDALRSRLQYGSKDELLPLVSLCPDITVERAERLYKQGLTTVEAISSAPRCLLQSTLQSTLRYDGNTSSARAKKETCSVDVLVDSIQNAALMEVERLDVLEALENRVRGNDDCDTCMNC
jgi:replicative superfamily II helicase